VIGIECSIVVGDLQAIREVIEQAGGTVTTKPFDIENDRLRWYEDGRLRYQSADEIITALDQFPAGTEIKPRCLTRRSTRSVTQSPTAALTLTLR